MSRAAVDPKHTRRSVLCFAEILRVSFCVAAVQFSRTQSINTSESDLASSSGVIQQTGCNIISTEIEWEGTSERLVVLEQVPFLFLPHVTSTDMFASNRNEG